MVLLFATFPVLNRLARDAGRPDLAPPAPFVVASTLAVEGPVGPRGSRSRAWLWQRPPPGSGAA